MADARTEILGRIRAGLQAAPAAQGSREESYAQVPRAYERAGKLDRAARTKLLIDRLGDYDAHTHKASEQHMHDAIAATLAHGREERLLVAPAIPETWLPGGFVLLRDEPPLSREQILSAQAIVTTCAIAIAETGTIVLEHSGRQGRRLLTLLPDHHICVVREEQIVETVSEALARLDPAAPLTTISGPSATADIEMVRIRGVHGPRRLTVLLLERPA